MTLFKIEDAIAESRGGTTQADILKMPFYELMLKLDIMQEKNEQREKEQGGGKNTLENKQPSYREVMKDVPKLKEFKPPSIKLPTNLKM